MGDNELDLVLVKRVQGGDNSAFDLLVRKYQHRIGAVVYRFVPDHAEAQDITQDAFIRAYRALPNFRGDAQFYTWLYRIAVNTAKNFLVASKRRPPTADIAAEDAEHFSGGGRLHDNDTPEHQLLRQEIEQAVTNTVAALPDDLRQAINLREVDGLSYEEIAQLMQCPIGTVRSRIYRAREAIDQALRPLMDTERVRP
ncbi:RNA polymerase sigma factor RpoE [Arenimonas alkanexedens]